MSIWSRIERRLTDLAGELLPDEFREQVDEARRLLDGDNAAEAAESLEALVAERPEHAVALSLLGAARLELGDPVAARSAFERAIAADPDLAEAHVGRGESAAAEGDDDTAVAAYRTAIGAAGGDRGVLHAAYRGLGGVYRRSGDIDKAIRELRKAVAESPRDGVALGGLGEALLADPDVTDEEAERYLARAADAEVTAPITWLGLGDLALRNGDAGAAGVHYEKALALATTDVMAGSPTRRGERLRALCGLGDAALAAGDAAAAHRRYLEALELDARRADVHARVAEAHRRVGDRDAAIASYERALQLGAGDDVLRAALDTAIEARAVAAAVDLANRVLARDPDDPRALVARGIALAEDGRVEPARATFRAALARGDDAQARLALARLELDSSPTRDAGNSAAAEALAALRIDPGSERGRALLAEARERALARPGEASAGDRDAALYRLITELQELSVRSRELGSLAADGARAATDFDQPLLVTVMGEFSSGKSTFVNAFIGDDVAPTGITPTTATINVVKYGRERGGRIHYRDGRTEALGWDELMTALRALDAHSTREVRLVEILVPLAALERINIVDTPGLNSILPEHEEVARGFIARADAVVWLFTANQAGKKSEKAALERIRVEGVRVLGVLNKIDQLAAGELDQVVNYVRGELSGLVEAVVPLSARQAALARSDHAGDAGDGGWAALESDLEERFFARARDIKREVAARRLGVLVDRARRTVSERRDRARTVATALVGGAATVGDAAERFGDEIAIRERRALTGQVAELYRRAAREVLELVRPRRLPFGSHSATEADRDYLVSLLHAGYESALEHSRRGVVADLRARGGDAVTEIARAADVIGADAASDLARTVDDAVRLVEAQVFARCLAYVGGFLRGGFVNSFFRGELPKIELSEDAVFHALFRDSPDLDTQIAEPLARAGRGALASLADRLRHYGDVADVLAYDIEVGEVRAIDAIDARRVELAGSSS